MTHASHATMCTHIFGKPAPLFQIFDSGITFTAPSIRVISSITFMSNFILLKVNVIAIGWLRIRPTSRKTNMTMKDDTKMSLKQNKQILWRWVLASCVWILVVMLLLFSTIYWLLLVYVIVILFLFARSFAASFAVCVVCYPNRILDRSLIRIDNP